MKEKIIFILKCFLVMVPFIWIAVYSKNNLMAFADEEAPYYVWNKNFCNTTQEKEYKTVIIGDSVANAAYMPEVLSDATVNLALGGITPMESYFVMKEFLDNNKAPEDVFISFMDFHLVESDCFWTRTLFSHRFKVSENWEMIRKAKKYGEPTIATNTCYVDFIGYEFYLPSKYITSLSKASFNQRLEKNSSSYDTVNIHRGRYIGRGTGEGGKDTVEYNDYVFSPLFEHYYRKLIELCLENNINVHIVKLPLPETASFTENYVSQFNTYYEQLKSDYPSIIVDWMDEGYDTTYFRDKQHMNIHGALKFSLALKQLYPEAFDEDFTYDQLFAINDSIKAEESVDGILEWEKLSPYDIEVHDTGDVTVKVIDNYSGIAFDDMEFEYVDGELSLRE